VSGFFETARLTPQARAFLIKEIAMAKSAEVDDPSPEAAGDMAASAHGKNGPLDAFGIPPLKKYTRRSDLVAELLRWYVLQESERLEELRDAAAGTPSWSPEALMHATRQAYAEGNRRKYLLAFEAFAKRATPLLLSQARDATENEREDQVQEVLLRTWKDIQADKAEYAEANFADYGKNKAIDLHRARASKFEGAYRREEPSSPRDASDGSETDPFDTIADRTPTPEARALLTRSVGKLEGKFRDVFIQYHVEGLTYEEIAEHHEVDESTIRNWVKRANALVGLRGGKHDRKD
jgi:RNA polymerase sigma factor (sigma-70 family)